MNFYIYRNSTIENIFGHHNFQYSGYNDIHTVDEKADAFVWFYLLPVENHGNALIEEIDSFYNTIRVVHARLPKNSIFLIFTLQNFNRLRYEQGNFELEMSIQQYNTRIIEYAREHTNVKIIDMADFTDNYTSGQLIDWKYYFISRTILSPRLANPFRTWFLQQVDKIGYRRKKCLILDLDNTIWGGILGEDGVNGIKTGGDYPGNAFSMFQQNLVELTKIGVVLAICSKNNEQDVLDVWEQNPDIKLKKEHIAAWRINWQNKAYNITQIAEELNIGLDSLVFIDDNPSERELVKQLLPQVEVPDFPAQPYQLPGFFSGLLAGYFSIYSLTAEDRVKTEQYKANSFRLNERKKFNDFAEYLVSLELEMEVLPATEFSISRIAQLTQKTNQFNLTTKRYYEADIRQFIQQNDLVYSMALKDRFGDSGISGAAIVKRKSVDSVEIDVFLLSCRVLGKEIEFAFLGQMLRMLKLQGVEAVTATYVPSSKNIQVQDFYSKAGFELLSEQNGTRTYVLDLNKSLLPIINHIKINKA